VIPRRSFDPRSIAGLVLWLDDAQSAGEWSAKLGSSAMQNATNNQPALATVGSRPALSFDGINDTLALPVVSLSAWHAFAVVNQAEAIAQTVLYFAASSTQSFSLASNATGLRVISASGAPSTAQALYAVDSRVGAGWSGGSLKDFYKGLIGEVLVYNAALSTAQENAVTRYLLAKWGI
jgi:hypothetical protein